MKLVDKNGWWLIKHNIVSKEGVFPYLGHTISDECEPNKIYNVYRPAETLRQSVPTWDNPPKVVLLGHEMVGEGFTSTDDRHIQGVMTNPVFDEDTKALYADITIYSDELKDAIKNDTKEISLGYFCKYKKKRGVFNGQVYDYVQEDMVGNHLAVVDAGRCGSDVKVFDHKCTMDSLNLGDFESPLKTMDENGIIESKETKGTDMYVTIDEVRRLLTESFTYGDNEVDPKVKLIMTALEAKAKQTLDEDETKEEEKKSEDSDDEEKEEKKAEDKCGKDEDEEEKKESEDCDEKKETADSIKELMSVVKDMADDIKKLVAKDEEKDDEEKKESEDGDDSDDESKEEKESEDEDEDEETKKSEDSAVFVFGQDSAIAEDEGLKEYLK